MKIALVLSEFVPVAIVPKYIELLLTLPLIIIANEKTYIEHGERVREYSLLASNTLLMYILLKLLNKIKNTYIFYIDISVINFSLIFELNKYSNLTNRLVGINVQSWAKTLQNGFYVYRTDNTCTGQYEDKKYTAGFVICFDGNIRIFMFDMISSSNCFTCSKTRDSNWNNYIKIS